MRPAPLDAELRELRAVCPPSDGSPAPLARLRSSRPVQKSSPLEELEQLTKPPPLSSSTSPGRPRGPPVAGFPKSPSPSSAPSPSMGSRSNSSTCRSSSRKNAASEIARCAAAVGGPTFRGSAAGSRGTRPWIREALSEEFHSDGNHLTVIAMSNMMARAQSSRQVWLIVGAEARPFSQASVTLMLSQRVSISFPRHAELRTL